MIALPILLAAAALAAAHHEFGTITRTGSAESTMAWAVIGHAVRIAALAGVVFLMGLAFLRGRS